MTNMPLKYEVTRLGPLNVTDGTRGESDTVAVFAYAVTNGSTVEQSGGQLHTPYLQFTERLQVIAPPGSFDLMRGEGRTRILIPTEPEEWVRVDAEQNWDANPFWSPGLSVFWFVRESNFSEN